MGIKKYCEAKDAMKNVYVCSFASYRAQLKLLRSFLLKAQAQAHLWKKKNNKKISSPKCQNYKWYIFIKVKIRRSKNRRNIEHVYDDK